MAATEQNIEHVPFRRTLTWKLIQVFFYMNVIGIALHFFTFYKLHLLFRDKLLQITYWSIAEEIAKELSPYIEPGSNESELAQAVFRIRQLHNAFDIYLLKGNGEIFYSPITKTYDQPFLEKIKTFLATEGYPWNPIYGVSHRWAKDGVPFSAAEISIAGEPGYLYVELRNQYADEIFRVFGDSTIAALSVVFLIMVVIATTSVGALFTIFLTRRFRKLTGIMKQFSDGNYTARLATKAKDEVGFHAHTFNLMAQTIQDNIEKLRENDESRRQLIANVSHDLRTPIGAIHLLMEALQQNVEEGNTEQQEELVNRALLNCENLRKLVGELFELSILESYDKDLETTKLSLLELLRNIVNTCYARAEEKELSLLLDCSKNLPPIFADEKLLTRAISNLVENAIRYSEIGGEVKINATQSSESTLRLAVSDNGIGIPETELPHIFERYYRGKQATEEAKIGTGLGLAITKRIAEIHEQDLSVESTYGEGSCFTMTLSCTSP